MRKYLFILFGSAAAALPAQNLISNGDFENYSSCPTNLAEVYKATSWTNVVLDADYYNCNFTSYSAYPITPGAYSGTGFMGFASYGNVNGAAEAIGQTLAQPLVPGTSYTMTFAAKTATAGTWSAICGGVAVYGFKSAATPSPATAMHASQLNGNQYLGESSTVSNNNWQVFSFNFIPTDTVRRLVFTNSFTLSCTQCLFIDSVNLVKPVVISVGMASQRIDDQLQVFPNPSSGSLILAHVKAGDVQSLRLFNQLGQEITVAVSETAEGLQLKNIPPGLFILQVMDNSGRTLSKRIISRE